MRVKLLKQESTREGERERALTGPSKGNLRWSLGLRGERREAHGYGLGGGLTFKGEGELGGEDGVKK